jgi:4-amino-4-deoxy-L-arabinose transferase-like glycosyltransferase
MNRTSWARRNSVLQKEHSSPNRSERLIQLLRKFSEWHGGIVVVLLILFLALLSRTISLSSFPYFPPTWPWNGVSGLYYDEYNISLLTPTNSLYFPFLQIFLMDLMINALGYSIFSTRLVSALFSSITCVLVYFSAYELFNKRLPAFLSSLFFILMTPALVYGRMAFVDNGATTLFVAAFLFAVKYLKTSKNCWLVGSGVTAGLSFLCKQTGLAAQVFLFLFIFIYKPKAKRQLLKVILVSGLIDSLYLVQILIVNPAYFTDFLVGKIYVDIGNISWLSAFLSNLMPSGVNVMWLQSYLAPFKDLFRLATLDFWYAFAFFVIVHLMAKERESAREVALALLSYVLVLLLVGHSNSYYVILAQPFMAIPFGYGVSKLQGMSGVFSGFFSLLLCLPAIAYICYYLSYFMVGSTMNVVFFAAQFVIVIVIVIALVIRYWYDRTKRKGRGIINRILLIYYVAWIISVGFILTAFHKNIASTSIQFVAVTPIAIIGIFRLIYDRVTKEEAANIDKFLVAFYLGCLIIGSYVLPVFYPGYFAQSSVPV